MLRVICLKTQNVTRVRHGPLAPYAMEDIPFPVRVIPLPTV